MPAALVTAPAKPTPRAGASSRPIGPDFIPSGSGLVSSEAKSWFVLAVASLVIAGLLSLAVVIGRLPFLSRLIDDPLFFKRCLVVHVDLSLLVWFYAFIAGLVALGKPPSARHVQAAALGAVVAGVVAMLAGGLVRGAQPILANYIPVIDHPVFLTGLGVFAVGIVGYFVVALVSGRPSPQAVTPGATRVGLQISALLVVLAAVTWMAARAGLPAGVDAWTRHEFTAWGPGHVLQVANVTAMLAVWFWLVERATGAAVLSTPVARALFAILVLPHFAMPLLTARGTLDTLYHGGATWLMRWTIFPVVSTVAVICWLHLRRHGAGWRSPAARAARVGFLASAGLTVLGMILGACIRGSTTLVPAHYHASLGGVTVAFMASAYLVAEAAVGPAFLRRGLWPAARRQLGLFGAGQAVFALGFGLGGLFGLGRKAYGAEQYVRSGGEYAGLAVMGLGGLVAVVAGIWFLFLILREMRGWRSRPARTARGAFTAQYP